MKDIPMVSFCTGGVRCEKAAPLLEREGFREVYQLDGGILKYFEECGGSHYEGECFVFDKRVGVDPALQETGSQLCFACQEPLKAAPTALRKLRRGKESRKKKRKNAGRDWWKSGKDKGRKVTRRGNSRAKTLRRQG